MGKHRVPDMPSLTLRVNVNEIEEAAKICAEAIWRFSKDAMGVLVYHLPDGREFQAHRTKTGVVVWSSQIALPNPLSGARRAA